ncbi:Asp-tRNA(Asn)/Glu-tRNA(Gln) amidotransferase subunit GatC [Membranihabitans marinus]|uniref:Asp-tRNA(Asn)/Glu-tRNA(Gln) amidotransferase subunit GatC n=1 Tax=Membranihabitans marinus TaxID=1227546 RepID=UPI001F02F336|nr:Asp-tRNA(Asn)/Glu-tRNA(Gln) amidotransferase subunit GatC [Membranihabitans marinus]
MKDITIDEVKNLERLAKLNLSEEERTDIVDDLKSIVAMFDKLEELDLDGIEPLRHITEVTNGWREDEAKPSLDIEKALDNAPSKSDRYFSVPKFMHK